MSVNSLAKMWRDYRSGDRSYDLALDDLVDEMERTARHAWRPVSEPPTEADGDERGEVVVHHPDVGTGKLTVDRVAAKKTTAMWARTCDVVLLPHGDSA